MNYIEIFKSGNPILTKEWWLNPLEVDPVSNEIEYIKKLKNNDNLKKAVKNIKSKLKEFLKNDRDKEADAAIAEILANSPNIPGLRNNAAIIREYSGPLTISYPNSNFLF